MENSPAALSVSEAAKYVGLGRTNLYELIRCGELPVVRIGGRTLVRRADALLLAHVTFPSAKAEER